MDFNGILRYNSSGTYLLYACNCCKYKFKPSMLVYIIVVYTIHLADDSDNFNNNKLLNNEP